jgi:hypothetical protein
VDGRRLLTRIAVTLALSAGFFVLLAAISAQAAPIRPDIRKLVSQPQESNAGFMPARAGWDGPEMPRQAPSEVNPALDPSVARRANEAALVEAATPDARAVLGIIAIIFLLRILKSYEEKAAEHKMRIVPVASLPEAEQDQLAA